MLLTEFTQLVADLTQDVDAKLSADAPDAAIELALARYSADEQRLLFADVVFDSAQVLAPVGFATMSEVDSASVSGVPVLVSPMHLQGGSYLYVDSEFVGCTVTVCYTALHEITDSFCSVPEHHVEPLAKFAAAGLLDQLAGSYRTDTDSTIASDSVNHDNKSRQFASAAKAYRAEYERLVVKKEENNAGTNSGAAAFVQRPVRRRLL